MLNSLLRLRSAAAAAGLFALLFAPSARAGGYYFPDLGTVALSRGGAFVARADNPTAIYYNPAGAARLGGTQILLNANLLFDSVHFQRRIYDSDGSSSGFYRNDSSLRMPEVTNTNGPFAAPFLGVTTDLGGILRPLGLVIIGGLYGPNAHEAHSFPRYCKRGVSPCEEGDAKNGLPNPARYDAVERKALVIYPTLGVAWHTIGGLSVGGVFQLGYAHFNYRTVLAAAIGEDPKNDIDATLSADSSLTPTGIVGAHWAPLRWLEVGASVRVGFTFHTSGEIDVAPPSSDLGIDLKTEPDPAPAKLDAPQEWVVRTGARYVYHDSADRELFDVELDFVWEGTSALQTFTVVTDPEVKVTNRANGALLATIDKVPLPENWKDTYSVRLGGSYRIHELFKDATMALRGGLLWESSAVPAQYTRLAFLPLEKYGFTLGAGLTWRRYEINIGYAFLYNVPRTVAPDPGSAPCRFNFDATPECGSDVRAVVPIAPKKLGQPVGNGRYEVAMHQLTMGARVTFGGP